MYRTGLDNLIGKNIKNVSFTEETLTFYTTEGTKLCYMVEGDCCSHSYFYSVEGIEKLVNNGPVKSWQEVPLEDFEQGYEYVRCYGFQLFTDHDYWGEQTSVITFRNESNGYYGGDMFFVGEFAAE